MIKRYKIPITILFVVLSFTALFVPLCSAGEFEYEYSLKELVDAGSLDVSIARGDILNPTYTSVSCNTTHWSQAIRYYPTEGSDKIGHYGLEIYSNNSSLFPNISDAKLFTANFGRFVWASSSFVSFSGDTPSPAWAEMRIGFRVLLNDGTFKYYHTPWISNDAYLSNEPSFNMPALQFPATSFSFVPPSNAQSVYSFIIEMNLKNNGYAMGSVGYVMMWGGKAQFSLLTGSLAEAEIYAPPDTTGYDSYHQLENELLGETVDGRESVDSAIDNGFAALAPGGTLYNSMYFWRELMNDAINQIPMLSPMITVSLAFGLVVFILGGSLLKVVNKDPDDKVAHRNSERRKRGKGN